MDLKQIANKHGTPLYVYNGKYLKSRAEELLSLCQPLAWTARYALKANSHPEIVKLFNSLGLQFDASSDYEAERAISYGVKPEKISLSSQQPPRDMLKTLNSGIQFVATSFHQLELVNQTGWEANIAVRINPPSGSGGNNRTTTGGASSSFGIWHEYIDKVIAWEKVSGCLINRLHVHVGSGAESKSWQATIKSALETIKKLPNAQILNMGGGFKVARMPNEKETNLKQVLGLFADELDGFEKETGRKIKLEIEPGTWLVANGGCLLAEIVDIVDTGKDGFNFLRLNTGMNDLLRPTLYGAQHPIEVLNDTKTKKNYVAVGHNCETGDILTPAAGDPEHIHPRLLKEPKIGGLVSIGGVGAYGASMRAVSYNSYPSAEEVFVAPD